MAHWKARVEFLLSVIALLFTVHCKRCTSYGNSVCLSVRPAHAGIVKTTARSIGHFALSDSKMCPVYQKPKNIPQGRPLPPEILAGTDLPLLMAASLDTFCLVAPQR